MKSIKVIFILFLNIIILNGQITSNNWMISKSCSDKLYKEFSKIDTAIYLIDEEINRENNQNYGGPAISQATIKDYYTGKYLLKCPDKVLEEINCLLSDYPSKINPRSLYLISYLLLDINDERYTTFLEKSLENLEKGNFDCAIEIDCKKIFLSLIMPDDGVLLLKQKYLEKNYHKESFQKLLNNIYISKHLSDEVKSSIKNEIKYLEKNKKY